MSFVGQQMMLRMATLIQEKNGGARIDAAIWTEIRKAIAAAAPGQGWLPTQAEAAAFMQRFEAGNERLRQRYFPDRPRLFADGSGRFPQAPMQADEAAILDVACKAFLKAAARAEMLAQTGPEPRGAGRGKGKRGGKGRRRGAQEEKSSAKASEQEPNADVVALLANVRLHWLQAMWRRHAPILTMRCAFRLPIRGQCGWSGS
jgi:hypothetical protein